MPVYLNIEIHEIRCTREIHWLTIEILVEIEVAIRCQYEMHAECQNEFRREFQL